MKPTGRPRGVLSREVVDTLRPLPSSIEQLSHERGPVGSRSTWYSKWAGLPAVAGGCARSFRVVDVLGGSRSCVDMRQFRRSDTQRTSISKSDRYRHRGVRPRRWSRAKAGAMRAAETPQFGLLSRLRVHLAPRRLRRRQGASPQEPGRNTPGCRVPGRRGSYPMPRRVAMFDDTDRGRVCVLPNSRPGALLRAAAGSPMRTASHAKARPSADLIAEAPDG